MRLRTLSLIFFSIAPLVCHSAPSGNMTTFQESSEKTQLDPPPIAHSQCDVIFGKPSETARFVGLTPNFSWLFTGKLETGHDTPTGSQSDIKNQVLKLFPEIVYKTLGESSFPTHTFVSGDLTVHKLSPYQLDKAYLTSGECYDFALAQIMGTFWESTNLSFNMMAGEAFIITGPLNKCFYGSFLEHSEDNDKTISGALYCVIPPESDSQKALDDLLGSLEDEKNLKAVCEQNYRLNRVSVETCMDRWKEQKDKLKQSTGQLL